MCARALIQLVLAICPTVKRKGLSFIIFIINYYYFVYCIKALYYQLRYLPIPPLRFIYIIAHAWDCFAVC